MKNLIFALSLLLTIYVCSSPAQDSSPFPRESPAEICRRAIDENSIMTVAIMAQEQELNSLRYANSEFQLLIAAMKKALEAKGIPAEEYERLIKLQNQVIERFRELMDLKVEEDAAPQEAILKQKRPAKKKRR